MTATAVLDDLRTERDEARDLAVTMAEGDDFDPKNPDFMKLQERAENLDQRIGIIVKAHESRDAAKALDARIGRAVETRSAPAEPQARDSAGDLFVRSEQFETYHFHGTSGRVELPMFDHLQARDMPLKIADDWGLPSARREVAWPENLTPFLSSLTSIPVVSNSVDVVSYALTNNADVVPESTAKPASDLVPTVTTVSLDTIAHFLSATRQLLEDSSAVRAKIDQALRRGVTAKMEAEAAAAITGAVWAGGTAVDADLLTAIRIAIGELEAAGYMPSHLVLNPADYAALDVATYPDSGTPTRRTTFWGLTVVSSGDQTEGTALVLDLDAGVEHYRRSSVSVYVTDSHASNFLSNIFTLLGEARAVTVPVNLGAGIVTAAA